MLRKFEVTGFKNFENKFVLDLGNVKGYEFNTNLVKNNIIRGGVIFGKNASGKSNLCFAVFDLVNQLTDKTKTIDVVTPYRNLISKTNYVDFSYEFNFNNVILRYEYRKSDPESLVFEKLYIGENLVIDYDYVTFTGFSKLLGTENLNVNLESSKMSFVKYIFNNSILEKNEINEAFVNFIVYINNMLLYSSLPGGNKYFGYTNSSESITEAIIKKGKLADFERFLNSLGIKYKLASRELNGELDMVVKFPKGEASFWQVASTGTKSICLYYYWLISSESASLVMMDEFDAYYHFELSEEIVKESLLRRDSQVIFTSHNTNLMTNDLFRPDCLFVMKENEIKSLSDLTQKEIRFAHNLQKMYKAGAFDSE